MAGVVLGARDRRHVYLRFFATSIRYEICTESCANFGFLIDEFWTGLVIFVIGLRYVAVGGYKLFIARISPAQKITRRELAGN